jgi:cobalt/nickel transport system permease protein
MSHKVGVFSEVFARKDNFSTRIEARIKVAFIAVALTVNLLSASINTSLAITGFCLITLRTVGIPTRLILLRLAFPLVMAMLVLIIHVFFYGTTPLFIMQLWGFHVLGYEEGLTRGFLVMFRVLAGVSLILFLGMSTPLNKLLMAAAWFRLPKIFVELALLIYRYIFVLLEEMITIKDAQKVRLGYHNWRQSMRSLGVLGGSLIFSAYDRAERVFTAMLARGYSGSIPIHYRAEFGRRDILVALYLGALLLLFYVIGHPGI